jgi:hypothetical protein
LPKRHKKGKSRNPKRRRKRKFKTKTKVKRGVRKGLKATGHGLRRALTGIKKKVREKPSRRE